MAPWSRAPRPSRAVGPLASPLENQPADEMLEHVRAACTSLASDPLVPATCQSAQPTDGKQLLPIDGFDQTSDASFSSIEYTSCFEPCKSTQILTHLFRFCRLFWIQHNVYEKTAARCLHARRGVIDSTFQRL